MTIYLRQSTASQEVLLGPFVDDTDGKTAETGLTIANTDIKIWKNGGTTESDKNSGGATHVASGRYYAVLDATDTNTIGPLEINVHVSGALPVRRECCVLDEAVYDVLFGTTAPSTLTAAGVNAEVLDVLNVDTFSEIGQEAPAATQTIRKMLGYLYKLFRNRKTQTASQWSLYADDGTTVDQKATVSDDGTTATKGEVATGP